MTAPFPAIAPSDEAAVILQAAGIGALFGTAVAARRRARDADADAWLLTARWTLVGAIVGVVLSVSGRVLW